MILKTTGLGSCPTLMTSQPASAAALVLPVGPNDYKISLTAVIGDLTDIYFGGLPGTVCYMSNLLVDGGELDAVAIKECFARHHQV